MLEVRRLALSHFGLRNLPEGAPLSDLRRIIVPVYLFHRYEVEAVAKAIGGADFTYAVKGDGLSPSVPVPGAEQRRSLAAMLGTLDPRMLALPAPLVDLLSAGQPSDHDKQYDIEVFGDGKTPQFSIEAASSAAADVTLNALLAPSRLARVAEQATIEPGQLGLPELLQATQDAVLASFGKETGEEGAIHRYVLSRLAANLATAATDKRVPAVVAADLRSSLGDMAHRLTDLRSLGAEDAALARYLADLILDAKTDGIARLAEKERAERHAPPPGMPIGETGWFDEPAGLVHSKI